jgi:hypothetical protein
MIQFCQLNTRTETKYLCKEALKQTSAISNTVEPLITDTAEEFKFCPL